MSSPGDLVAQQAQQVQKRRLQEAGLQEQYELWREALPDQQMNEGEVYNLFMDAQLTEEAAVNGRLSVTTGGAVQETDTDIPAPGPDDEEGGPDEAGDTSEGGDGESEPIEGLWIPPKESEAENYEAPTTDKMTHSAGWLENARIVHEFMGSPNSGGERAAVSDKFGSQAYAPMQLMPKKPQTAPMSDEQVGQWAREEISGFNWNVATMASYAQKIMTSNDPKAALAFLNLINMYDHSDGGAKDFAGAVGELFMDPTSYIGVGVGTIAAKGAAKAVIKTKLSKMIQMGIIGGAAGSSEGALLGGGFDLTLQNIEQEAGAREDIDKSRVALSAAVGGVVGKALGTAVGSFAGRQMDKFAELVANQRKADAARDVFLNENRSNKELSFEQLTEMLQHLNTVAAEHGEVDPATTMARRIYDETGGMPRTEDGSIDFEKIHKVINDVEAEHAAKLAEQRKAFAESWAEPDMDAPVGGRKPEVLPPVEEVMKSRVEAWADTDNTREIILSNRPDLHALGDELADENVHHQVIGDNMASGEPQRYQLFDDAGLLWSTWQNPTDAGLAYNALKTAEGGNPILIDTFAKGGDQNLLNMLGEVDDVIPDVIDGKNIVPFRNQNLEFARTTGAGSAMKMTPEEVTKNNGFVMEGNSEVARVGKFLNDQDIVVTRTTDDSITFDIDSNVTNPEKRPGAFSLDKVIRETASSMGLKQIDGIGKTFEGTNRTLEVKGTIDELVKFARAVADTQDSSLEGEFGRRWKEVYGVDYGTPIPDNVVELSAARAKKAGPAKLAISDPESQRLISKILELEELERGDIVLRTEGRPGSRVVDELGDEFEVVGRNKQGWFRVRDKLGRESNMRRKQFTVVDKAPAPRKAGPMELDPFGSIAAKVMEMNERALNPEHRLKEVTTTHAEQAALARELEKSGIDVSLTKRLDDHWTPAELMSLRDIYNKQANGMADLARRLTSDLNNNGVLTTEQLASFNNAHMVFVATRDLFYGTSGNAARQLNILRSKPVEGVYDFSQSLMDSINLQGGRANTERAIKMMAEFANPKNKDKSLAKSITELSDSIWGNKEAALLLNVRYNMMLSSWRTHFFNFLGNTASGVYHHFMVSPVRMGINNLAYARDLARSVIQPEYKPDPTDRLTAHSWIAELQGHFAAARESFFLAKEIAMGRDIGEGKAWNELGLRYDVINVPSSTPGKIGTTPVRLLEAGDAFFKNQYYNSKIHELASINARADEINGVTGHGKTFEDMYKWHIANPDSSMERQAKAFAQKQTYTNDTSVYRGLYAVVADSVIKAQNRSVMVNMLIPFVKTPANLLGYSMEAIGLTPSKTWNHLTNGSALERQEALAQLTVAGGLWFMAHELYQNGEITGAGPSNWEERKAWEAAGWQAKSYKIHGNWVDVSRSAPLGHSLSLMASVFDYYSMAQHEEKPAMDWLVGGLLYTADAIVDENYLSTVSDLITGISSKQESRVQSITASTVNSIFVPNLLRDFRRPADPTIRRTTHPDFMGQLVNQMRNATPGYSDDLPPSRDWSGKPMNYYGNAYMRALLPFNVKDSKNQDPATMAVAYARIPVSIPDKTITWPGGLGDAIDLYVMDSGGGFVYDEYLRIVGESKLEAVNELMNTPWWRGAVDNNSVGPNSEGDRQLRRVLALGTTFGRLRMLDFLIEHSGDNSTYYRTDNEGNKVIYQIHHQVSVDQYIKLQSAIRHGEVARSEDTRQYLIEKPIEGPEFFKP